MKVSGNTLENCSYGIQWVPPQQPLRWGDPPPTGVETIYGGWWIVVPPPVYYPVVTHTHVIVTSPKLTDAEVDRIAERVADKIAERKQAEKRGTQP